MPMRNRLLRAGWVLITVLGVSALVLSQSGQQNGTLLVSGHSGQVPVLQMNGRSYVSIEALARLANGSLKFSGKQITLTLPDSGGYSPPTPPPETQAANP
jgi:hypothetical protein